MVVMKIQDIQTEADVQVYIDQLQGFCVRVGVSPFVAFKNELLQCLQWQRAEYNKETDKRMDAMLGLMPVMERKTEAAVATAVNAGIDYEDALMEARDTLEEEHKSRLAAENAEFEGAVAAYHRRSAVFSGPVLDVALNSAFDTKEKK